MSTTPSADDDTTLKRARLGAFLAACWLKNGEPPNRRLVEAALERYFLKDAPVPLTSGDGTDLSGADLMQRLAHLGDWLLYYRAQGIGLPGMLTYERALVRSAVARAEPGTPLRQDVRDNIFALVDPNDCNPAVEPVVDVVVAVPSP